MIIYIRVQTSADLTELLMFNDLQNIPEVGFLNLNYITNLSGIFVEISLC